MSIVLIDKKAPQKTQVQQDESVAKEFFLKDTQAKNCKKLEKMKQWVYSLDIATEQRLFCNFFY